MELTPEEKALEFIAEVEALAKMLLTKLAEKTPRVQDKYDYYNADNDTRDYGISVPRKMRNIRPGVGWAARAVNTLSDRINFDGFANDTFGVNKVWDEINGRSIVNKAKHDSEIAGCAFVAIADDLENDRKTLIPFTALEATGTMDMNTGLLKYGLAVTRWSVPDPKKRSKWMSEPLDYILYTTAIS